jgi:hypothetical protein
MTRASRLVFHVSNLAASVTGLAYAYFKWLAPIPPTDTESFGLPIHPFEPTWKSLHVLLAFLLVFGVGWIWHGHVQGQLRKWRKNPVGTRKRGSGLALVGLAAPMVVSGYAFQVSVEEATRSFWSQVHLWSGMIWIMASLLHLSKRSFLRTTKAWIGVLLFSGCATVSSGHSGSPPVPSEASRGERSTSGIDRIIDAHVHTRFKSDERRQAFFAEMKANGVVGAVAHTGDNGARGYEDLRSQGVIHCFGIGTKFGKKEQQQLDQGLASGKFSCIKIYLGYIPKYATDPVYEPAYRLAARHGVPVVFHTGDTYDRDALLKYAEPMIIDEVSVAHRNVTFVIAHCGNPWIETAAEIAYKNPNVYLDGSAFLIGKLENETPERMETYVTQPIRWIFGFLEDPTKLMFGTDWPLAPMAPYIEAFQRAIPPEHWQAVFHDNALRVFPRLREVVKQDR